MKHSFTKLCTALAILIACCLTTDIYAQTAVADTATAVTSEVITATETTVEEGSVADTVSQLVSGVNTVWMLLAAMLVFFMQPGFALVEAGFTRTKNTANILMKNFVDFIFGSLLYWFVGFGIMFGGTGALIGGFDPFIQGDYSHLGLDLPLWVYNVTRVVKIRTGEEDFAALQDVE